MRKNRTTHFMAGILIIIFVGVFLLLTGRFLYIQATGEINDVSLEEWAEQKRTSSYTMAAERGKIFDNNGMALAYDRPTFRMYAILDEAYTGEAKEPKHVVDPEKTAKELAPLLDVKEEELLETIKSGIEKKRFQVEFGNAGKELSQQKKDEIAEKKLPGIKFEEEALRYYPNGMFASQVIGFARDTEVKDENGNTLHEIKGIAGIENVMDDILKGIDGKITYQRDKYNKKLLDPSEVVTTPENGDDIYLTIDQKIQTLLEDAMTQVDSKYNPERMSAVVMNPKTGEIVAMSNRPSYNPNDPSNVENWYNDVISTPFEPGSTVKMFTWAAAIEEGVYNGEESFESGSYRPNKQVKSIGDHNRGEGWGPISYDEGFQRSSNVAAAKLAWEKIGSDTFLEYLKAFQLDEVTGIDLPGEVKGEILYNWPLEKITSSFGQGSTMTPIQQLKAATAIANNGEMLQPYVIKKIVDPDTGKTVEEKSKNVVGKPISEDTANHVLKLLESVVNGEHGTGKMYKLDDYTVGGKTGTAQIPNNEPGGGAYMSGKENHVFSFLGMAPIDDPQLMMYVTVKQPELEPTETGADPVSFIFKNVMENGLHYLNISPDNETTEETKHIEVPSIIGKKVKDVLKDFEDKGIRTTALGNGEVIAANVEEGETILANDHVILVTDNPEMPNVKGWSLREVLQLSNLLELETDTTGSGFVTTQSIKAGTQIKKGDSLSIELLPPNNEQEEDNDSGEEEQEDE
ncbi:penicillin-binding protein [Oceanobacillus manasiensis]|uniref:penicillin-binding protein n=1 Tax=Oceanobacillus manasiensis TaxID=586413 RepID=UPI0005A9BC57|nr:penicillin-binding protein [Oceanobacillus manasiensis]